MDENNDQYCKIHNLDEPVYPNSDPHCPRCREEQRIAGEMEHRATRDPQVEPW